MVLRAPVHVAAEGDGEAESVGQQVADDALLRDPAVLEAEVAAPRPGDLAGSVPGHRVGNEPRDGGGVAPVPGVEVGADQRARVLGRNRGCHRVVAGSRA
ncbi:MAG: hypothetical protein H0X65_08780 [Gemmatimonadetes bacterium]|nr:hypothetical protein [Gemmatimonadota bacterium]